MDIFSEFFFVIVVSAMLGDFLPRLIFRRRSSGKGEREAQQSLPPTVSAEAIVSSASGGSRGVSLLWVFLIILFFLYEIFLVGSGEAVEILTTDYTQGVQFEDYANTQMIACLKDTAQTVSSCLSMLGQIFVNGVP